MYIVNLMPSDGCHHLCLHGPQGSVEWIEDEAKYFKCDGAKQGLILVLAQHHGSMRFKVFVAEKAFGNIPSARVNSMLRLGFSPSFFQTAEGRTV
jgi:hypothetical protein